MNGAKSCLEVARCLGVVLIAAGIIAIAACSDQASEADSSDTVGRPNPAAVFCEQQGGEYLLGSSECRLESGTVVDAWSYYRENAQSGGGVDSARE